MHSNLTTESLDQISKEIALLERLVSVEGTQTSTLEWRIARLREEQSFLLSLQDAQGAPHTR